MQTKRLIWFLIMIAAGIGIGLLYGWIIQPLKHVGNAGDTLRADYKADYVLMVSEIYDMDGNLDQAAQRLKLISAQPASEIMASGLETARALGYAPADLSLIEALSSALQKNTPTPQGETKP
jgi:hypothetical protein